MLWHKSEWLNRSSLFWLGGSYYIMLEGTLDIFQNKGTSIRTLYFEKFYHSTSTINLVPLETIASLSHDGCHSPCHMDLKIGHFLKNMHTLKLEAIQRWSAICRMWRWTLTYQKFLLCVSSQSQDLYSHQKLHMHIYWFSSESSYRCRWRCRQCRTPQYNH